MGELMQEMLENKTAFTIPIFGGIPVGQSIVVMWGVMAFLVLFSVIFVRNLKEVPTGMQAILESFIGWMNKFFYEILGEAGKPFVPYLGTVLLFLGVGNLTSLVGITPPTKNVNVTAGLALMSLFMIVFSCIYTHGFKGWLKSFTRPVAIILPINILDMFTRPLSLCVRLFGNVLGAFIIMELIKHIVPVGIPVIFSLYFDIFDGLIQAYIFVFLTSMFMSESIENGE